jgi:4-hydroxyphenylacetate 3-monooxygenase
MVRTGQAYLEGLKDNREVWLNDERVTDVTAHPALAGAAQKMAEYYDLHHEAADVCQILHPETGEPMSVSHLIPRSHADLTRRRVGLERIAEWSFGVAGRTPDYVNVSIAGFAGQANIWAANGNDGGAANLVAFHQELIRRDLALTHAIIHPTVDKSMPEVHAGGGEIALHKVADTEHGILVRGARLLATLAPFADEIAIYPGQPIPTDAHQYALAFSIPISTPGLKFICRDSFSIRSNAFDHPFSSCFDEQDAFVVFHNVEVPRHRVFVDGNVEVYNRVLTSGWVANIMQQTTIRAMVKLEFAYELATEMVRAIGGETPSTVAQLGELWTYAELTRAALRAAEAEAHEWGNGVWFCDDRPFRALRPTLPRWFVRVNDILKSLGAHNLLTTPTVAQLAHPELGPLLNHYLQGANRLEAEIRTRIFRAAWDFVGTSLGSRAELYERFYLGSVPRTYQLAHFAAQKAGTRGLLERFLSRKA